MTLRKIQWLTIICLFLIACSDRRTPEEVTTNIYKSLETADYQAAHKDIIILIEKAPENSNAYYLKGLAETKLEKDKEAIVSFQRAIDLDASNYQAFVERAKLKIKLGDYNSGIEDCDKAKFFKKDYADIYYTKATAYEALNDVSNAIIGYEHAIKYGENNGETYYKLGMLLLNSRRNHEACESLSKAGELGFMDAYDLIKSNCNNRDFRIKKNEVELEAPKEEMQSIGQFKSYPGRYSITFPSDWKVDEISNSSNSVLTVSAQKGGHFMTIIEVDPTLADFNFNAESIWDLDKEDFLYEYRQKYSDFKLIDYKKLQVNRVDAYYFKMFFSFFSERFQKRLSGIHIHYTMLNPETRKIYLLQGAAKDNEIAEYEPIYKRTFETFKFF